MELYSAELAVMLSFVHCFYDVW